MDYTIEEIVRLCGYSSRQSVDYLIKTKKLKPSKGPSGKIPYFPIFLIPEREVRKLRNLRRGRKRIFGRRKRKK